MGRLKKMLSGELVRAEDLGVLLFDTHIDLKEDEETVFLEAFMIWYSVTIVFGNTESIHGRILNGFYKPFFDKLNHAEEGPLRGLEHELIREKNELEIQCVQRCN